MQLLLLALLILSLASLFTVCRKKQLTSLYNFNLQRTLPLRAILALLIVIHHISYVLEPQHLPVFGEFLAWGKVVVGVFFFITGYGLMVSYQRKGDDYLHGFLLHRMRKLLPPFLLVLVGWLSFMTIVSKQNAFLALGDIVNGDTALPNSWFVLAVLFFYVFFFIAAKLTRKPLHINLLLWCFSTLYIVVIRCAGWGSWWYNSIYALNVGFSFAYCEPQLSKWLLKKSYRIIVCQAIMMVFLTIGMVAEQRFPACTIGVQIATNCLVPLFVVLTVYVLGMMKSCVLDFLGRISYEIYLVHGCVILYLWGHSRHWVLFVCMVYGASIVAAWVLNAVCKKLTTTASTPRAGK